MNEANYASLEASKRLVEAGIVLETEAVWRKKRDKTGYYLSRKALYHRTSDAPAPSMAEIWRELPDSFIEKRTDHYCCSIALLSAPIFPDENPADALIDLLIWVRQKGKA